MFRAHERRLLVLFVLFVLFLERAFSFLVDSSHIVPLLLSLSVSHVPCPMSQGDLGGTGLAFAVMVGTMQSLLSKATKVCVREKGGSGACVGRGFHNPTALWMGSSSS